MKRGRPPKEKAKPPVPLDDDDQDTDEGAEDAGPVVDQQAADRLVEFQEKFSEQNYKIRIERFNDEAMRWEVVTRVPLAGFDPYEHCRKYGGALYRCDLLDAGGRYVKGGRMEFALAKQIAEDKHAAPTSDPLVEMLKLQNAQTMELLKAMLAKPAPAEAGMGVKEIMALLKDYSDINPRDRGTDMNKILDLFVKFRELTESGGGNSEEGDGVAGEIKQMFKLFMDAKGGPRRALAAPTPPAPTQAPPAPRVVSGFPQTIAVPTVIHKEETAAVSDPVVTLALSYAPKFAEYAARGTDAAAAAAYLYSVLELEIVPALIKKYYGVADAETIWERLLSAAEKPDVVEKIFEYAPVLALHRDWTFQVIQETVALVAPPEELDPEKALDPPAPNGVEPS